MKKKVSKKLGRPRQGTGIKKTVSLRLEDSVRKKLIKKFGGKNKSLQKAIDTIVENSLSEVGENDE